MGKPKAKGKGQKSAGPVVSRACASDWRSRVPAIAERMRQGLHLAPAARLEGVPVRTLEDAIARDDPDTAPLQEARAQLEARLVADLLQHSQDGRHAGATTWMLERIAPKRWRQADQLEVSGPDGGPVRSEAAELTPEQLRERLEALRKKLEGA